MKVTITNYGNMDRKEWVTSKTHYGQCVATVAQIKWSENTEAAIQAMADDEVFALNDWYDTNQSQIEALTALVRGSLEDLSRAIIVALITTDVHARDIVDDLRKENVCSTFDFTW
jgi:dynein heavy chain